MKLYFFLRYSPAEDYQSTLYLKISNLKDISMLIRSNRVHEKRGKQTQKRWIIFPRPSYDKFCKIKALLIKLIVSRPKYLKAIFLEN